MSNSPKSPKSQYEMYGLTGTPFEGHEQPPYGAPRPDRGGYMDTYRPAYEALAASQAPTEPILPRQTPTLVQTQTQTQMQTRVFGDPAGEPRPGGRAAARRAARRRRAAERPDPLRRLLPQALVVAFLAGGASAFVASDKAIELSVDGKTRTLHTFADDVTELLAEEGVRVGEHDVVAPAPGTALSSGDEIAVHHGRPVRLTLDGQPHEVWTTAHTVDGALQQLGVRAEGAYLSTSRSRRIGREGLALDVRTERTVTIMADGRARTIRTNAATVGEAVEEAGITLHGQDTTSVPPESFPGTDRRSASCGSPVPGRSARS